MERDIMQQLVQWKLDKGRKPLILNGARQVGKTWILKEFGRRHFEDTAYVNCDHNQQVRLIFEQDYDLKRILLSLQALLHKNITAGRTLLIFDEVQENPRVLASLKYFCEEMSQLHVVVAGSLLGLSLHSDVSFPVGKVDMLRMYPMTFDEFLRAIGEDALAQMLASRDFALIDGMRLRYVQALKEYYYVGGMPAVVQSFVDEHDLALVRKLQQQILFDYRRDFSKHAPAREVPRINMVWDAIPSQLAKENKKFVFGALRKGARAADYEMAIQWLIDAGLVYPVCRVSAPKMPLKFYEEASVFKLFSLDVGLTGAMAQVPPESVLVNDDMLTEYKGAFTELYVLTQLIPQGYPIYYYSSNDSRVEVDFVVQHGAVVTPVEVKASVNVHAKSLRAFIGKHPGLKGLRLSLQPHRDEGWMENVPLYAVGVCFGS